MNDKNFTVINNKGLTLVELMVVMVLSLLLMAAVYMTYQLQHAIRSVPDTGDCHPAGPKGCNGYYIP